jgi:NADH-quinone oxidoreductase subunit H
MIQIFLFIVLAFLCEWIFRKTYARVQKRYGPLYRGKSGILQPFADFFKLLSKEDFLRGNIIFDISPVFLTAIALFSLFFIPIKEFTSLNFEGDILVLIFLFDVYALWNLLLGEFSKSRFSRIGAMRQVLLFFSFEIPLIFSIACFFIYSNSLTLSQLKGFSPILLFPFIIFLICSLGKIRKLPFDIGIAEQELVSGYETELSGRKLALLKLSENLELVFASSIASVLLFGIQNILQFLIEVFIITFLLSFLSAAFPRYRIDQAINKFWKVIFPLSLVSVILCYLL